MKRCQIDTIETADIYHDSFLALFITPSPEGLHTTDLTKKMGNFFGIETILGQMVFTRKKHKLLRRNECENESLFLTMRTIADHGPHQIRLDLVPHCSTVTSSGIFLHNYTLLIYSIVSLSL